MSVEHWETYYRGGAIATCPTGGPDPNYSLELRDTWVEFFAALPDGARILDIGTGNGAVALIARDTAAAAGRQFDIHGADLARIDPPRQVRGGELLFEGIRFHPGVPTEHMPFDTAGFDAVSGQFALEYSDASAALSEIFRVLKTGGRARFSVHNADSAIVQNARVSLAQSGLVLDESRIFRRLRSFIEAERQAAGRTKAATAWNELNRAAAQLQQEIEANANAHTLRVTLDAVQKLLAASRQMSAPQMEREIEQVEREVRASVRRLQDLIGAARSAASIREMADAASALGFEVSEPRPQLQSESVLVGWLFDLRKPDTASSA